MATKKPPADPRERKAAEKWFRERVAVTQPEFNKLSDAAKRQAFTIGGVHQLNVVQTALEELARTVRSGQTLDDFRERLHDKLEADFASIESARLKLAFQTSTQRALGAGRWEQLNSDDGQEKFPYWLYDPTLDLNTTPMCRSLEGVVVRSGTSSALRAWPPLHWFCRTQVRGISARAAAGYGITDHLRPPRDMTAGFGLAPPLADDWKPDASDYDHAAFAIYRARVAKRDEGSGLASDSIIKLAGETPELFNQAQPRVPKGGPGGGRWTKVGGGSGTQRVADKSAPTQPAAPAAGGSGAQVAPGWMTEAEPKISRQRGDALRERGEFDAEVVTFHTPEGEKKGLWKPVDEHQSWQADAPKSEAATAALDRVIHGKLAVVPHTVERELEGRRGSLQEFVPNATSAYRIADKIAEDPAAYAALPSVRRTFLLDVVTRNIDRHGHNLLWSGSHGEHAHAIDNGYAFRTLGRHDENDPRFQFPVSHLKFAKSLLELDRASVGFLKRTKLKDVAATLKAHRIDPAAIRETLVRLKSLQKNPKQLTKLAKKDIWETQLHVSRWLGRSAEEHGLTRAEIRNIHALVGP